MQDLREENGGGGGIHEAPFRAMEPSAHVDYDFLNSDSDSDSAAEDYGRDGNDESTRRLRKQRHFNIGPAQHNHRDTSELMKYLSVPLRDNLTRCFGPALSRMTSLCLPLFLSERDFIAYGPLYKGDYLPFTVPLVQQVSMSERGKFSNNKILPVAIVLATAESLDEIGSQVDTLAEDLDIKVRVLHSRNEELQAVDILVTTPQVLQDIINEKILLLYGLQWIVYAEAEHIFNFLSCQGVTKAIRAMAPKSLTCAMFASWPTSSLNTAINSGFILSPDHQVLAVDSFCQVKHEVQLVENSTRKRLWLVQFLNDHRVKNMRRERETFKKTVVIFVQNEDVARQLLIYLKLRGLQHGTMLQGKDVFKQLREGSVQFALGSQAENRRIHALSVQDIVLFDIPHRLESLQLNCGKVNVSRHCTILMNESTDLGENTVAAVTQYLMDHGAEVPEVLLQLRGVYGIPPYAASSTSFDPRH